jgi:hypothetical protein
MFFAIQLENVECHSELRTAQVVRWYEEAEGHTTTLPTYSQLTKELCVKAVRWLGHSHRIAVLVMAAPHQFGHNELPLHRSVHGPQ